MSKPSDKAVEAARVSLQEKSYLGLNISESLKCSGNALDAAHDPALGLDRSVCLRDVLNVVLRWQGGERDEPDLYGRIEREFGGATKTKKKCSHCLGRGVTRRCPACGTHTGTHWHDWCPPMEEKPCGHCNGTGEEPT